MTSVSTLIEVGIGLITFFGIGFGAGKYLERSNIERKQLKKELDKFQENFAEQIKTDPKIAKWIRDNTEQLLEIINKMQEGDKK